MNETDNTYTAPLPDAEEQDAVLTQTPVFEAQPEEPSQADVQEAQPEEPTPTYEQEAQPEEPTPTYEPEAQPEALSPTPVKKQKKSLTPIDSIIFNIFSADKWLQICQLAFLIFCLLIGISHLENHNFIHIANDLSSRHSQFIYTTSSIFCVFYIIQLVYACIYKLFVSKASIDLLQNADETTPQEQLYAQQYQLHKKSRKANKYIISSILGIFMFIAFITSSLLFEYSSGINDIKISYYISLFAFIVPSIIAWSIIHYRVAGFAIIVSLLCAGVLEAHFAHPVVIIGTLVASVIMAIASKHNDVLRFYGIFGTIIGILLLLTYGLFGAHKINGTICFVVFMVCFIPAILTSILQICACGLKEGTELLPTPEAEQNTQDQPLYKQIFDIFHSYVWGGLCALIFLIISIIYLVNNYCGDKNNAFFREFAAKITKKTTEDKKVENKTSETEKKESDKKDTQNSSYRYNSNYNRY